MRILFVVAVGLLPPLFKAAIPERGEFRRLVVPETLDLEQRALIAFEANLAWAEDKNSDYADGGANDVSTPNRACCGPKFLEALAYIRAMTGTTDDLNREAQAFQGYERDLGKHHLFYVPPLGPIQEPWANVFGQGRLILAWLAYWQTSGDSRYLELSRAMAHGLSEIAIPIDDYAYFPTEIINNAYFIFAYRASGWKSTEEPRAFYPLRPGQTPSLYDRDGHQFDARMGIPAYVGSALRPLPRLYKATGDPEVLKLACQLAKYLMKPEMWQAYGMPADLSRPDRAQYSGHVHGHLIALRGLLDLAMVTHDRELKEFVRAGYDYTRNLGYPEIGWFPEWTNNNVGEGCEIADMVALAIRLSDLGMGDYWDDVDCYIRNQLVENQHVDGPNSLRGKFAATAMPTQMLLKDGAACCTPNCTQALYYAWEGITRYSQGHCTVNLLLNRAAPWADVLSDLPYNGKVRIQNHLARSLSVRLPAWVNTEKLQCEINDRATSFALAGHQLFIDQLKSSDTITVRFPMEKRTVTTARIRTDGSPYAVHGLQYTIEFKGNTAIRIIPEGEEQTNWSAADKKVKLYQREHYRQDKTPLVSRQYFVRTILPEW